jgi:hypothetical protein
MPRASERRAAQATILASRRTRLAVTFGMVAGAGMNGVTGNIPSFPVETRRIVALSAW